LTEATFDGHIQNFPTLWKKFSVYAKMARIKSILKEERDVNLPEKEVSEIDEQDEKGKLARLAVSKNELAMASFLIAFTTNKAMNILYAACTENWPDGEAHLWSESCIRGTDLLIQYLKWSCISIYPV
jgi:hypothetical protein